MELTAPEIISIIRACNKNNVSELELGFLHLTFRPNVESPTVPEVTPLQFDYKFPDTQNVPHNLNTAHVEEDSETPEFDEEEDRISYLIASDPLEYERLKQHGELDAEQL